VIEYNVGDVIAYEPFGGGERVVVVRNTDDHNGQPAGDGYSLDKPEMGVWFYADQVTRNCGPLRTATVDLPAEELSRVIRFLPQAYRADFVDGRILIRGYDYAGWTLEDYVIPRLASGLITAREVSR
jgi:hypothetical protein